LFQCGKAAHFTGLAWGLNHLVVTEAQSSSL